MDLLRGTFSAELTAGGSSGAARLLSLPGGLTAPVTASGAPRLTHLTELDADSQCFVWYDSQAPDSGRWIVIRICCQLLLYIGTFGIAQGLRKYGWAPMLMIAAQLAIVLIAIGWPSWMLLTTFVPLMRSDRLVFYEAQPSSCRDSGSYTFGITVMKQSKSGLSFFVFLSCCSPVVTYVLLSFYIALCLVAVSVIPCFSMEVIGWLRG